MDKYEFEQYKLSFRHLEDSHDNLLAKCAEQECALREFQKQLSHLTNLVEEYSRLLGRKIDGHD